MAFEMTENHKQKISDQTKKNWSDMSYKNKTVSAMKGKKRTPEQIEAMRAEHARRRRERIEGR
jgi:hypothetical protein